MGGCGGSKGGSKSHSYTPKKFSGSGIKSAGKKTFQSSGSSSKSSFGQPKIRLSFGKKY